LPSIVLREVAIGDDGIVYFGRGLWPGSNGYRRGWNYLFFMERGLFYALNMVA
jgi:hypothetical protein